MDGRAWLHLILYGSVPVDRTRPADVAQPASRPHNGPTAPQTDKVIMGLVALIALTTSLVVLVTALVLDLAGISRRGTAMRVLWTGLLIMNSAALINTIAQVRGWPYPQQDAIGSITFPMTLTGGVIGVGGGVAILGRERRRARRAGHSGETSRGIE